MSGRAVIQKLEISPEGQLLCNFQTSFHTKEDYLVSRVEKESVLAVASWSYQSLICARLNVAFNYDLVELSKMREKSPFVSL